MAYKFRYIRNPEIRKLMEEIFAVADGHDHDGVNSKAVTAGVPADGSITLAKCDAGVQASLALADSALQAADSKIAEATPTNAKYAGIVLTIDGVVVDGETVTFGDETYEFAADAAQTVTAGNIAVNIEAATAKSTGTLTIDTIATSGDTMVIGTVGSEKTYTFVPNGTATADGEIAIGADLATAQTNIEDAINGTDGVNTPHAEVSCGTFDFGVTEAAAITALVGGVAGDAITTTSSFSAATNKFTAEALGGGAGCTKGDGRTALIAEITTSSAVVDAAAGAGDTVVITAQTLGTAGNVAIAETMENGAFAGAATKLAGGTAGTVGKKGDVRHDATYVYVCTADNTVADANWRRVDLGSAY